MLRRALPCLLLLALPAARGDEPKAPPAVDAAARRGAAVHGGQVAELGGLLVEVVLAADELRVYVYDRQGQPLAPGEAQGRAELTAANVVERGRKRVAHQTTGLRLEPRAKDPARGHLRAHLVARHQLGAEGAQAARLGLTLSGLPGGAGGSAELTFPRTTPDRRWVCPGGCGGAEARFHDPGSCPKCSGELEPEGKRGEAASGEPEAPRPRRSLRRR